MSAPRFTKPILGVIRAPEVYKQPHIALIRWSVFQLELPDTTVDMIVGINPITKLGRVSTPIHTINLEPPCLFTQSGRRYVLRGQPCVDPVAWSVWFFLMGDVPYQNVSDVYLPIATDEGEPS